MRGVLTSIAYTDIGKRTQIHLFVRGEDGKRHAYGAKGYPYFYMPEKDLHLLQKLPAKHRAKCTIDMSTVDYVGFDKVNLRRVFVPIPRDTPYIRDRLHKLGTWTYEADIPYTNRWLIDKNITLGIEIDKGQVKPSDVYVKPRYWIIDIEALVNTEEAINVEGSDPIICIGLYDSYTKKYFMLYWGAGGVIKEKNATYIACSTERLLIETFFDMMEVDDPDILMGFNLAGYDIPKIISRAKDLHIDPSRMSPIGKLSRRQEKWRIKGREIVDVYDLSRFLLGKELRAHSLDYVNRVLGHGEGKYELEEGFNEAWANNKMKLLRYNKRDLDCVLEIELEQDLVRYLDEIRNVTGVTYGDIQYKTTIYDMYVMRKYLEHNRELGVPRKILETNRRLEGDKYPGAFVLKPDPGVYHNVVVVDFASLYPNIFITFNLGYWTIQGTWDVAKRAPGDIEIYDELFKPSAAVKDIMNFPDKKRGRRYYVSSKKEAMIADILTELLHKRANTKKKIRDAKTQSEIDVYTKQDAAFKVIVNSAYGVMGKPGFRLYKPDTGAAVTAVARHVIQYAVLKAQSMGHNVIYGDTDSIFISLGEDFEGDLVEAGRAIATEITKSLTEDLPYMFSRVGGKKAALRDIKIELDMETVYGVMAIWAKKNYLGKISWTKGQYYPEGKYKWKGRGDVRSDTSILTRDLQVVLGKSMVDIEPFANRVEYLDKLTTKIIDNKLTLAEVGIPKQIRKPLEDYVVKATHVRGAAYSNEHFGTRYGKGDKPMWAYVTSPRGYPKTDCISFTGETAIPDGFLPDYKIIVRKQVQPIINSFLKLVGEEYKIPTERLTNIKNRLDGYV